MPKKKTDETAEASSDGAEKTDTPTTTTTPKDLVEITNHTAAELRFRYELDGQKGGVDIEGNTYRAAANRSVVHRRVYDAIKTGKAFSALRAENVKDRNKGLEVRAVGSVV